MIKRWSVEDMSGFFLSRIFPSSGLLRGVRWFETDVSGLPIRPIVKGHIISSLPIEVYYARLMVQTVPKRRFQTTSHRVITQKTEELSSTAAESWISHFSVPVELCIVGYERYGAVIGRGSGCSQRRGQVSVTE
jgi:hypothetical protein